MILQTFVDSLILTAFVWKLARIEIEINLRHISFYFDGWLVVNRDSKKIDVFKSKHFPRCWSPVNSPHKGQWRGALMCHLICAWTNGVINCRDAGDLGRLRAHYDVTVMIRCGITETIFHECYMYLMPLMYASSYTLVYVSDAPYDILHCILPNIRIVFVAKTLSP